MQTPREGDVRSGRKRRARGNQSTQMYRDIDCLLAHSPPAMQVLTAVSNRWSTFDKPYILVPILLQLQS